MRSIVIVGMILLAAPALADCPTREAMEKGATVYVSYPDGGTVGLRWMGAGMIEETTRYAGQEGSDFRMISMGGVFIVNEVDLLGDEEIADSRITSRYPDGLYQKLPVMPESEMSVTATNFFADGTESEEEHLDLRTGAMAEIDIAGCRYNGFPMLLTYHWEVDSFTSMMTHLPELGVSVEIARAEPSSEPVPFAPERFSLTAP